MRITIRDLRAVTARLNKTTGAPVEPWRMEGERMRANIGNYHISEAYGGYSLHRMTDEGGGVSDVIGCGHIPARDLYERMHAFIRGLELGRESGASDERVKAGILSREG